MLGVRWQYGLPRRRAGATFHEKTFPIQTPCDLQQISLFPRSLQCTPNIWERPPTGDSPPRHVNRPWTYKGRSEARAGWWRRGCASRRQSPPPPRLLRQLRRRGSSQLTRRPLLLLVPASPDLSSSPSLSARWSRGEGRALRSRSKVKTAWSLLFRVNYKWDQIS